VAVEQQAVLQAQALAQKRAQRLNLPPSSDTKDRVVHLMDLTPSRQFDACGYLSFLQ
jgi:hypothetical protein